MTSSSLYPLLKYMIFHTINCPSTYLYGRLHEPSPYVGIFSYGHLFCVTWVSTSRVHLRFLFSFVSWLSWSNFSKVWCIHSENHKQNHQMSCSVHYFNPQCCPLFLLISLAVPSWILLGTFSIPGSKAARPVNRLAIWPVNFSPLFLLGKRRHGWSPAVLSLNNLGRFNC